MNTIRGTPTEVNPYPANLVQAARSITHSDEQYQNFISQAYQHYLNRTPDAEGLQDWSRRMSQGLSDEQLEAGFIGSAEYIADHGGSGPDWIKGMYQDLLGRQPDDPGLAGWLNALAQGTSPQSIAYGFATSKAGALWCCRLGWESTSNRLLLDSNVLLKTQDRIHPFFPSIDHAIGDKGGERQPKKDDDKQNPSVVLAAPGLAYWHAFLGT